MYNPCVVKTKGEYQYKMWFFGWALDHTNQSFPGCDAIFHARSKDMLKWEVYSGKNRWDSDLNPKVWQPVITASDQWYEAWHVGDPSVVEHNGKFYMAYSATSKHFSKREGYPATMVQCLMGAISEDGINWKKSPQPILINKIDSKDPKPAPGRIGDFHRPSLNLIDGKWKLWFDYWHPKHGVCMGLAECEMNNFLIQDGFSLLQDINHPIMTNWPNPEILKTEKGYICFADPVGYPIKKGQPNWMSRQLQYATSKDGIRWHRKKFLSPDKDSDACHVPQSLLIGNQLYLFYSTQIGYSKNDGKYHYQYDRIRFRKYPLEYFLKE